MANPSSPKSGLKSHGRNRFSLGYRLHLPLHAKVSFLLQTPIFMDGRQPLVSVGPRFFILYVSVEAVSTTDRITRKARDPLHPCLSSKNGGTNSFKGSSSTTSKHRHTGAPNVTILPYHIPTGLPWYPQPALPINRIILGPSYGPRIADPTSHIMKNRMYKTRLCRNWEKAQSCQYGYKCQFAWHSRASFRATQLKSKSSYMQGFLEDRKLSIRRTLLLCSSGTCTRRRLPSCTRR